VVQIQPVANSHWGEWGPESFCPDNSWAQGFKLKVESDQGDFGDDTALNGVKLLCYDSAGAFVGEAASAYEQFGSWQAALYCSSRQSFLTGIRLRSKDPSASLDETAANNVDMYCGDGTNLPGGGMHWGEWTYAVSCPAATAVCGIKTKVQPYAGGLVDDTALNEVILMCCDLSQTVYQAVQQCAWRSSGLLRGPEAALALL